MLNLTDSTFHDERVKQGFFLADFWGIWCPPCKAMNVILEEVAANYPSVTFAKVNSTENPDLTTEYEIQAIPSFILFKDGEVIHRWTGMTYAKEFGQILETHGIS